MGGSGDGAGPEGGGGTSSAGGGGAGGQPPTACDTALPWAAVFKGMIDGAVVRVSALASDACETYVGLAADGPVEGFVPPQGGDADGYVMRYEPNGDRGWVTSVGGIFGQHVRAIAVEPDRVWIGGDNDGGLEINGNAISGSGGFVFALDRQTGERIPTEDVIVRDDDSATVVRVHDVAVDGDVVHTVGEFGGQLEVNLQAVGPSCSPSPCGMWITTRDDRAPDVRVFQAVNGNGQDGRFVVEDILVVGDKVVLAAQVVGAWGGITVAARDAVVVVYGGEPISEISRHHFIGSGEERVVGLAPLGTEGDAVIALVAHSAELSQWDLDSQMAVALAPSQPSSTVTAVELRLDGAVVSSLAPWEGVLGQTSFANDVIGRRQLVSDPMGALRAVGGAVDDANLDGINAIDLLVPDPLLFTVALTPSATTLVDVADSPHTFSEGSVVQTLSHVALAGDHEVIGGYHGPDAMPVDGSPAITSGFAGFVIQRETGAGGR